MNTLIAKNLNILIDFLAKRDLTALTPDKLQAKYKINQADLLILFGGSIPEGADVFAKAHQQNIAKNYLFSRRCWSYYRSTPPKNAIIFS